MTSTDGTGLVAVESFQLGVLLGDSIAALGLLGDISRDILEQREELAQAVRVGC